MGNIPLEWYDDYPHIGYDLDGRRVYKPMKGDEVCTSVVCLWVGVWGCVWGSNALITAVHVPLVLMGEISINLPITS